MHTQAHAHPYTQINGVKSVVTGTEGLLILEIDFGHSYLVELNPNGGFVIAILMC